MNLESQYARGVGGDTQGKCGDTMSDAMPVETTKLLRVTLTSTTYVFEHMRDGGRLTLMEYAGGTTRGIPDALARSLVAEGRALLAPAEPEGSAR